MWGSLGVLELGGTGGTEVGVEGLGAPEDSSSSPPILISDDRSPDIQSSILSLLRKGL